MTMPALAIVIVTRSAFVDRLGEGDRVARPRAGDRDRPVVDAPHALDRDVGGGQRLGLIERDRQLVDAQPGQVGVPAGRQQAQAVGGGLERGGLGPPADGDRRRRCRLELVGADVDGAVEDPREAGAALIGGQGCPVAGSTARALLPASMAGLPGKSAMVWVGPPLSASGPRPGLATPTWLPLAPLVRPPEPPVPIRLYALVEATVPARTTMSPAAVPLVFWATIVLSRVAVPAPTSGRRRPNSSRRPRPELFSAIVALIDRQRAPTIADAAAGCRSDAAR